MRVLLTGTSLIKSVTMKFSAAQKQKRYPEKLKKNDLHNAMKAKNRARMEISRSKLSDFQREQYRNRDARVHHNARATKKFQLKYLRSPYMSRLYESY